MILRFIFVVWFVQWGGPLGGLYVGGPGAAAYVDYDDDNDDEAARFYDKYRAEERLTRAIWTTPRVDYPSLTRMPRYHNVSDAKSTLSPQDLLEVKGALKQLLSGRDIDSLMEPEVKNSTEDTTQPGFVTSHIKYVARLYRTPRHSQHDDDVKLHPTTPTTVEELNKLFKTEEEYAMKIFTPTRSAKPASTHYVAKHNEETVVFTLQMLGDEYYQKMLREGNAEASGEPLLSAGSEGNESSGSANIVPEPGFKNGSGEPLLPPGSEGNESSGTANIVSEPGRNNGRGEPLLPPGSEGNEGSGSTNIDPEPGHNNDTEPNEDTKKPNDTDVTATCSSTKVRHLDIVALLNIISNLTYDYETNLTRWVNETLQKWSIPTCATPTTTTTTTPTTTFGYDYDANGTGVVVAKCYVCGLEVEEIPRRAHCADAFAGDFLPLVPVDPVARGQIGLYRKYCRYMDVPQYHYNVSDTRSVWGRWTGGCSVRWIDLSGVYTQRTCRNRFKPLLGRHFVSKRMAKLEMALQWVDNGCIISPAASLVPLSRGISLYARFHACVCTGSWCNRAPPALPAPALLLLLLLALGSWTNL